MTFLAVSTNLTDVGAYLDAEFAALDALTANGTLVNGWVRADFSGSVLVIEAADETAARATLDTVPTARAGATLFELTEIVDLSEVRANLSGDRPNVTSGDDAVA